MTTRHYDAVVIGGQLSAAILGALLAKRGIRGLVIDQGELASADSSMLPDLVLSEQGSLAIELVHSELGVREDLKVRSLALTPAMQAIFPDQRVDLFSQRPAMLAELRRAFGAAQADLFSGVLSRIDDLEQKAGEFLATAGELPATGFFARRSAASAARKHPTLNLSLEDSGILAGLNEQLVDVLLAPLPFMSFIDARRAKETTVARFVRAVGRFLRGLSALDDGEGLRALYFEIAKRKGVEVRKSAVEAIEPKGKQLHIRVVGHRDDLITTDAVIDCSVDLSGLDTIPAKQQSKDMALTLQSAKPRGFLHAYAIEVDRTVIPPGMADQLLLLNGRKDPSRFDDPEAEDRPIWVTVQSVDDARVVLVAAHPVSRERAKITQLDQIIRARLVRLIPFLDDGAPAVRDGFAFPTHPLFTAELDPLTGVTGVPMRTSLKNVFIAGPTVLPGLGVEGEYLSALQAADALEVLQRGAKKPKTLAQRAPSIAGA